MLRKISYEEFKKLEKTMEKNIQDPEYWKQLCIEVIEPLDEILTPNTKPTKLSPPLKSRQ